MADSFLNRVSGVRVAPGVLDKISVRLRILQYITQAEGIPKKRLDMPKVLNNLPDLVY